MKVCQNCRFHINVMANPQAPEVWYNHLCKVSPLPECIDPVTGQKTHSTSNDFGNIVTTDNAFSFCRDINRDGNCSKYSEPIRWIVKEAQP